MSNILIDTNILGNKVTSIKTRSNIAKNLDNLHFSEILGNQVISRNMSKMSKYLMHKNIIGN